MVLLLVFMQLTRDLFAIAKFLFSVVDVERCHLRLRMERHLAHKATAPMIVNTPPTTMTANNIIVIIIQTTSLRNVRSTRPLISD